MWHLCTPVGKKLKINIYPAKFPLDFEQSVHLAISIVYPESLDVVTFEACYLKIKELLLGFIWVKPHDIFFIMILLNELY